MLEDEYFPIEKAAVLANCGVRDLIHAGALGRLPIYVIADGWQFSEVREIYKKGTFTGIRVIYKDADEPNSPLFLPLDGLVPLYARCLSDQEDKTHNNASVQVTLDLTGLRPAPFNENVIRYVKPDPAIPLSDAKMLIMIKDLMALQSGAEGGATSLNNRVQIALGQKKQLENTQIKYARFQEKADEIWTLDSTKSTLEVAKEIVKILNRERGSHSGKSIPSFNTIRQIIKKNRRSSVKPE